MVYRHLAQSGRHRSFFMARFSFMSRLSCVHSICTAPSSCRLREALQIILGILIPLLIIEHVIATRIASKSWACRTSTQSVIRSLWINSPMNGLRQSIALVVVWTHGCIGVHFWLRYRAWYYKAAPFLLTFAILLPVLALLGFARHGADSCQRASAVQLWQRLRPGGA